MLYRIICLIIGYIFGLIQTAYIYGEIKHIDIREHGSGNAGTTNALRTLGKKAGLITFLGDTLKPVAAMAICYFIFRDRIFFFFCSTGCSKTCYVVQGGLELTEICLPHPDKC